jgi:hypothetical protein
MSWFGPVKAKGSIITHERDARRQATEGQQAAPIGNHAIYTHSTISESCLSR